MQRRLLAVCLLAAGLALAAPRARADQDAVEFFHNIVVTPDAPVGDAVCFFCNVRVEGKVDGDIVVFFGSVHLNGDAHHDVVDFFGHVSAANGSSIGGDLVTIFGSIRLGEDVSIAEDMVTIFGSARAPSSVSIGGDRMVLSPWIFFGPLFVFILVIYLIVHELRTRRQRRIVQRFPAAPLR